MPAHQAEFIEKDEIKLVGFSITESLNHVLESRIVGKLRETLAERKADIKHRKEAGIYLIQIYNQEGQWTHDTPFQHVVGFEVSALDEIPTDMTTFILPPGRFVRIVHHGAESEIGHTYDYINNTYGERPIDIEYWNDIYSLEQTDSQIDILIPAK
ncbi:GyrI-like domain-containing protein [Paenibacillus glycanilyticus]|uniref:GyrI-like domain-containing protein n=1 Tax=Paenibacillus glycanilyticus TaxID=126569 RepID=UPI00203B5F60|nr:effector binding domain-containing protein [Paenibacillus glycanilyticus]MCM3630611.1 GyrI-like domain-containing protein [Paenibacillus glycanilyticus]